MIIFYKIFCKDLTITDCYVGQTTQLIKDRFYQHQYRSNTQSTKFYKFVLDNGGWDNFDIIKIDETEYWDESKEFELMKIHNATLNTITLKPIKTEEELKKCRKEYRQTKVTCLGCGKELQRHSLTSHKKICVKCL